MSALYTRCCPLSFTGGKPNEWFLRVIFTSIIMTKERYNKGDAYEDDIFNIMKEKKLLLHGAKRAGASNKGDVQFIHRGKIFNLEIKNVWTTDFGQKRLIWSKPVLFLL